MKNKKTTILVCLLVFIALVIIAIGFILMKEQPKEPEVTPTPTPPEGYSFIDTMDRTATLNKMNLTLTVNLGEDNAAQGIYHFTLNRDSELDKIEASVKNSKEEITWNASYNYQNHLYYYNNEEPGVEISGDKYFDHIFDLIKEGQTLEGDKVLINKDKMKDILSVSNIPYMLDKDNKMEITVDEDITMEFDIDKDNNLLRGMKCYFTINGGIPVSFNYSFEIPNN